MCVCVCRILLAVLPNSWTFYAEHAGVIGGELLGYMFDNLHPHTIT